MKKTREAGRERKLAAQEETRVRRPQVNVALGYPLYDEALRAAATEPVRGLGSFVAEVFRYGWRAYQRVGSLKALKELDRGAPEPTVTSKRISAERCAILAEALNLILERGNSAIIEAVERYLIEKAGKFGEPRK